MAESNGGPRKYLTEWTPCTPEGDVMMTARSAQGWKFLRCELEERPARGAYQVGWMTLWSRPA